jgi:hypothetical protein
METRHQLKGIERRSSGLWSGRALTSAGGRRNRYRTHCVGRGAGEESVDLRGGLYGPGFVPRGTQYRIDNRVMALRIAAKPLWFRGTRL